MLLTFYALTITRQRSTLIRLSWHFYLISLLGFRNVLLRITNSLAAYVTALIAVLPSLLLLSLVPEILHQDSKLFAWLSMLL